jgi:hypothetical protein
MGKKYVWLIVLLIVSLLVAACGPEMATPTPRDEATAGDAETPTKAPVAEETEPTKESTDGPETPGELPVDAEDWHILGSREAPVTIIEYSDFQ